MSIEDHDQFLKISLSKLALQGGSYILMGLLSLNGWFINRLINSIDQNVQNVQEHSIRLATLDEKLTSVKISLDRLKHKACPRKESE